MSGGRLVPGVGGGRGGKMMLRQGALLDLLLVLLASKRVSCKHLCRIVVVVA